MCALTTEFSRRRGAVRPGSRQGTRAGFRSSDVLGRTLVELNDRWHTLSKWPPHFERMCRAPLERIVRGRHLAFQMGTQWQAPRGHPARPMLRQEMLPAHDKKPLSTARN